MVRQHRHGIYTFLFKFCALFRCHVAITLCVLGTNRLPTLLGTTTCSSPPPLLPLPCSLCSLEYLELFYFSQGLRVEATIKYICPYDTAALVVHCCRCRCFSGFCFRFRFRSPPFIIHLCSTYPIYCPDCFAETPRPNHPRRATVSESYRRLRRQMSNNRKPGGNADEHTPLINGETAASAHAAHPAAGNHITHHSDNSVYSFFFDNKHTPGNDSESIVVRSAAYTWHVTKVTLLSSKSNPSSKHTHTHTHKHTHTHTHGDQPCSFCFGQSRLSSRHLH